MLHSGDQLHRGKQRMNVLRSTAFLLGCVFENMHAGVLANIEDNIELRIFSVSLCNERYFTSLLV